MEKFLQCLIAQELPIPDTDYGPIYPLLYAILFFVFLVVKRVLDMVASRPKPTTPQSDEDENPPSRGRIEGHLTHDGTHGQPNCQKLEQRVDDFASKLETLDLAIRKHDEILAVVDYRTGQMWEKIQEW